MPTFHVVVRLDGLFVARPVCWSPGAAVDPSAGYVFGKVD